MGSEYAGCGGTTCLHVLLILTLLSGPNVSKAEIASAVIAAPKGGSWLVNFTSSYSFQYYFCQDPGMTMKRLRLLWSQFQKVGLGWWKFSPSQHLSLFPLPSTTKKSCQDRAMKRLCPLWLQFQKVGHERLNSLL